MRVSPNLYDNVNAAISQSEQQLQSALNQLSSGKRVSKPSDDPLAFASDVQSLADSAQVDTYTKNSDAILTQAQMADSALSSVTTCLTQAVSIGTEAGNSTLTSTQRTSLAQQMQALLQQVVAQANSTGTNGQALFSGTASTSTPFVSDPTSPDGYVYQGNSESNQAQIGDHLQATVNIPGDTIFNSSSGDVLGSLQQMISAVQSGSSSDLANATTAVSAAIAHVGSGQSTIRQHGRSTASSEQLPFTGDDPLDVAAIVARRCRYRDRCDEAYPGADSEQRNSRDCREAPSTITAAVSALKNFCRPN